MLGELSEVAEQLGLKLEVKPIIDGFVDGSDEVEAPVQPVEAVAPNELPKFATPEAFCEYVFQRLKADKSGMLVDDVRLLMEGIVSSTSGFTLKMKRYLHDKPYTMVRVEGKPPRYVLENVASSTEAVR